MTALPAAHGWGGEFRPGVPEPPVVREADDHVIVELHGDQDLLVEEALREALADACARGCHVLVDLSAVRLIDSTVLGLLVRAHQDVKRHRHFLCLVAPSRFVVAVLHTMRLRSVFPDFATREEAANWLTALPPLGRG